jgi:hypothetical protein
MSFHNASYPASYGGFAGAQSYPSAQVGGFNGQVGQVSFLFKKILFFGKHKKN